MDCPDRMPRRGASRPLHNPLCRTTPISRCSSSPISFNATSPTSQRAFHAEFAALGGEQGLEALEFAAPEGFDVAVALAVAVGVEGDGAQLQAAVVGLAADFQAVAGGGGFAQDDPAGPAAPRGATPFGGFFSRGWRGPGARFGGGRGRPVAGGGR